ncbi:SUMF1/EgtB/PvdO family nonheme iron enzyme [Lewinella sp. W8]|uniref:SUMF1/EgtB/PvdO family nonheme iron enzyme n=1 Tax=Lewinella sp. W8 TaxID=2528208 RepID=UPI0010678878|nr:SUMF1/EgtB/PvdO family nonheme iron enzyme [Lewinella sp. W8]MTB52766.1 SUMF1/EgtB/PvdO family nonheme iron enzyme [Lewinella sp. W8]
MNLRFYFLLAPWLLLALPVTATDYALFFAVEEYEHMAPLSNPIDNVTKIADELRDSYGFRTEVVSNPTFADIASKIHEYEQLFASGEYDQQGQLLIFFSGHGVQEGNNGYFIPKDGDPSKLYERVIEYDYWRNKIDQIACQHILVTIDACHSITFDPNWRNKTDRNFGRRGDQAKDLVRLHHKSFRARLFFTSDGENNETPDRSTLARQFLNGLRTHRSANGYLSASVLFADYLKASAPVPGGGDFGSDDPGSRFLFFYQNLERDPEEIKTDLSDWQRAQSEDSCPAYKAYLEKHPNGDFVEPARQKLEPCEAEERMFTAWQTAKRRDDCEAYLQFLADYPESPYASLLLDRLRALNCSSVIPPPENMVLIPGGTFQMGDQFGGGSGDEKPVHPVSLTEFYLGLTEVTNREYAEFLSAVGNQEQGGKKWCLTTENANINESGNSFTPKEGMGDHPVATVNWYGAIAYCNWLSEQHGLKPVYRVSGTTVTADWTANGYRLPTEAEWEYAARSGGQREKWAGTFSQEDIADFAKYGGKEAGPGPVGMLRANNLGLADMSGNVWEWCWDRYAGDYYKQSPQDNPRGPSTGTNRALRGGSYWDYLQDCSTTSRYDFNPLSGSILFGFRIARNVY